LKINVMKEDLPCHKTKLDSNVLRRLRVRTGMWPGTRVAEGSHIMKLNTGEDPAGFFWCVQTQEEVRDIQNFAATFKQSTYVFSSPAKLAVYSDNFNESEKTLVESLASYYVEEIQLVHPRGPYFLAGTCVGTETIYEIARQLSSRGFEVKLLLLVEPVHAFEVRSWVHAFWGWLFLVQSAFIYNVKQVLELPPSNTIRGFYKIIRKAFRRLPSEASLAFNANSSRASVTKSTYSFVRRTGGVSVFRGSLDDYAVIGGQLYLFPQYAGRVHLIFGRSSPFAFVTVKMLRRYIESYWKQRALGGLEIQIIPGSHEVMGTSGFGEAVAAAVNRTLFDQTASSPDAEK